MIRVFLTEREKKDGSLLAKQQTNVSAPSACENCKPLSVELGQ